MPESENFASSLSPVQRRLIASALALIAAVVIVGFLFGVFLLLRAFVSTFSDVLWPIAVAGILAMILRPLVVWFDRRLKLGRVKSIVLLYAIVLLAVGGIISFAIPVLFEQSLNFIEKFPSMVERLRDTAEDEFPQVRDFLFDHVGEERLEKYQDAITSQATNLIPKLLPAAQDLFSKSAAIIAIGTGLAIIPVYLFFFLRSNRDPVDDLGEQLSFLNEQWRDDVVFLVREFVGSMEAFFRGQILIGLIMGLLLAVGFTIAGINFGIGLGLMIGALNIIPYFGTIIGLATVLPIAYLQPDGGLTTMLIALGIFVAVQMIEGYILTPKIMGKETGLHPLAIIIAIFFWGTALNGLLGMILAIPLTAFFVVAWRLARKKYLAKLTA